MAQTQSWIFWALLSAGFAALTAIFAKVGVTGINSDLATWVRTVVVPFDQILEEVRTGKVDAGVVIHEGQLTYQQEGLVAVTDLGAWWKEETGDPLPLGGNGIRKDLDPAHSRRLCRLLTESIAYGLDHRQEAMDYAMRYARGLEDDPVRSDRFVGMYVNDWTLDFGPRGRQAVTEFLARGHAAGIIPHLVQPEFVD